MEIQRLDPANNPITYCRVVIANGIAYFTDHIARPECKTVYEQTAGILDRYVELFDKFHLKKENVVLAVNYYDKRYGKEDCVSAWNAWLGDIEAEALWVPVTFDMDRQVALTLFVATDEKAAARARADKGWVATLQDMHRVDGSPIRVAKHNGVYYLVGGACMDGRPIAEQTKYILREMEYLFKQYGLKKENMLAQFSYVSDRPEVDLAAYEEVWQTWVGRPTENPPSGVRVQLEIPKGHDVEITIMVAVDEEVEAALEANEGLRYWCPDDELVCMNRGQILMDAGRYEEATAAFSQAIIRCPEMAALYDLRGTCMLRQGDPFFAAADYKEAHRLNPEKYPAYTSRIDLSQYPAPYPTQWDEKLKADPDNELWWHLKIHEYANKQEKELGVQAASLALLHVNDPARFYQRRAHWSMNLGILERAAADFTKAALLRPNDKNVLYHTGIAYFLIGEYRRAEEMFARSLELADSNTEAISSKNWLWATLVHEGKEEEAKALLDTVQEGLATTDSSTDGYYKMLLLYKGCIDPETFLPEGEISADVVTIAYGLVNYYNYVAKDEAKANAVIDKMLDGTKGFNKYAFGFRAAENERERRARAH